MKNKKEKKKLTNKQKILLTGVSVLGVGVIIGGTLLFMNKGTEDDATTTKEPDIHVAPVIIDDEMSTDNREVLSEDTIEQTLEAAMASAYQGDWKGIVKVIGDYDKEYNIDESENGRKLRNMMFDANTISRLQDMGDNPEAVEKAVNDLPHVNLPEMFVLGLYYLPRNVLLELSLSSLSLAPSQRGHVEIVEEIDLPQMTSEGYNTDLDDHDIIGDFFIGPKGEIFVDGFKRYEIINGGIEEYVYISYRENEPFYLLGFYSDDDNPANTTKTVSHYMEFREMINEGIDKWYETETNDTLETEIIESTPEDNEE